MTVLWDDLLTAVPRLNGPGLNILDAGGGAGHLAVRLAQLGHRVVLAEPASEMRERAQAAIQAAGVAGLVTLVAAPLQGLDDVLHEIFDLVVCHAVLEWLADSRAALSSLAPLLASDGQLSLLFYNRNAALLKRVLHGEFGRALDELAGDWQPRGWGDGCVPLAEDDVSRWLTELGLSVQWRAGIRIFHDHLPPAMRHGEGLDLLLQVERAFRNREPFASLAQHLHLVCDRY
jgi:S-adenosylmethionine-dependent methyltransferase